MRAKFRCTRAEPIKYKYEGQDEKVGREEIEMWPVTGGSEDSEENKSWALATPGGYLRLSIDNPDAFGHFVVGTEYYLDFHAVVAPAAPAPEPAPEAPPAA